MTNQGEKGERRPILVVRNETETWSCRNNLWYLERNNLLIFRKEYWKELYANKFDNLDETEKFLERHEAPKLTQDEIENLNRSITKRLNVYF